MRTETTTRTLYTFAELSDEAQQHALEKLWDLNVDHDWWYCSYEAITTAARCLGIDCKVEGFALDRGAHVALSGRYRYRKNWRATLRAELGGDILSDLEATGAWLQAAQKPVFWSGRATLEPGRDGTRYSADADYGNQNDVNFLIGALRDFEHWAWRLLRDEYGYLTSYDAIKETIEANGYEFDANGDLA